MNRDTIDHIHDNSRGCTLLASARADFLNTNSIRVRFEGGDGRCVFCEYHPETLEHFIMGCGEGQGMEIEIRKRLDLHEDSTSESVGEN